MLWCHLCVRLHTQLSYSTHTYTHTHTSCQNLPAMSTNHKTIRRIMYTRVSKCHGHICYHIFLTVRISPFKKNILISHHSRSNRRGLNFQSDSHRLSYLAMHNWVELYELCLVNPCLPQLWRQQVSRAWLSSFPFGLAKFGLVQRVKGPKLSLTTCNSCSFDC